MNTTHSIRTAQLDPTFGDNGTLEVRPPGNFRNDMTNLIIDTSGRLVIYGAYMREAPVLDQPGVARLNDDGSFETAFGDLQDGLTTTPDNVLATHASSLVLMADGAFFITGSANTQLPLVQYDKDGRYMADREVYSAPLTSSPRLLISNEQKVLVATSDSNGGALFRHHSDGTPDDDFGEQGKITFLSGKRYVATLHMAHSVAGAFYLAGEVLNDGFILRLDNNGKPDETFAERGLYTVKLAGYSVSSCRKAIELVTGNVLALVNASGSESTGEVACYLIQLTPTGEVDPTFNRGDPLRIGEISEDIAVQADGKFLVAHRSLATGNQLTRYLPGGLPDANFGNDGTQPLTFNPELVTAVKNVIVQPDGKIVISGKSTSGTTLLRLA